ncbi:hypothetical protein BDR03DRAFT_966284 [Suillus americanus]|nr:hypothetical protein BDR03DRAFT_966284 [Suillus americanus]
MIDSSSRAFCLTFGGVIELHRAALAFHHPGYSDRSMSLDNLSKSLHDKFLRESVLSDLDEAVERQWISVTLAILMDPCILVTILPTVFATDSGSGASCLTSFGLLRSIEL